MKLNASTSYFNTKTSPFTSSSVLLFVRCSHFLFFTFVWCSHILKNVPLRFALLISGQPECSLLCAPILRRSIIRKTSFSSFSASTRIPAFHHSFPSLRTSGQPECCVRALFDLSASIRLFNVFGGDLFICRRATTKIQSDSFVSQCCMLLWPVK